MFSVYTLDVYPNLPFYVDVEYLRVDPNKEYLRN